MHVLATFILIALLIIGALCLAVLEYQNFRARSWNQFWSTRLPDLPPQTTPPEPSRAGNASQTTPAGVA